MMVRFWMTKSPETISKTASLYKLLMYTHKYSARRFPVIDDGILNGIVSVSDLYRLISPRASRLTQLPLKYKEKLIRHTVEQIMVKNPVTCKPNDHLEDVASIMRKKKIGSLPVMKDEKLIGIITESDVLDALIKVSAGEGKNKRITLKVPCKNHSIEFYQIVALCEKNVVNISTILTHPCDNNEMILITLRISGKNTKAVVDSLWDSHHQVLAVE